MVAIKSWLEMDNKVVYFNDDEKDFENVTFRPCSGKPGIATLANFCGTQTDWCAIVNADIVLGETWPAVEAALRASGAKAAISRRWTLDEAGGMEHAKLTDQGLDIFAATPEVWRAAARFVPKQFKLGHILWDTWMLSFFVNTFKTADFTSARVVFHPRHEHRGDQAMLRSSDSYLEMVRWPALRIGPQRLSTEPKITTAGGGRLAV
jgi:hypothetical protein